MRGIDDPFSDLVRDPEEAATFDAAMAHFTRMIALAVAATYDFKPFRTIVDVGGGNGALLIGILDVIHDWDDDRALVILRNCHRVMAPGAKLLLVEGVYPPRIDQSRDSRGAAANDVNMLVNTGGRQRSEAEFRSLYEAAGFDLTRIVPTPAPVSVIEGTRR
jgi:hypothetical protein